MISRRTTVSNLRPYAEEYPGIDLSNDQYQLLQVIDNNLLKKWFLGRNIILCWSESKYGIDVLYAPYYQIGSLIAIDAENNSSYTPIKRTEESIPRISDVLKSTRYVSNSTMSNMEHRYGISRGHVRIPGGFDKHIVDAYLVDSIVKQYSLSFVNNHAVALFDIVGFSKYNPFEQVTLLSSLSYSINSACHKLKTNGITIDFARSTTGDGFYIWTREPSIEGNMNLYYLVQLILADNAIARMKSYGQSAPILKTAFHIGNYYEFYQSESLHPTSYSYIVGDVTIELARIIENALPGQILVGDFYCKLPSQKEKNAFIDVNTFNFIEMLRQRLLDLRGILLSDREIGSIACYLTGEPDGYNNFNISKYLVRDKHHQTRLVYNAKVNIYREDGPPLYLGVQEKDVNISVIQRVA